MQKKATVYHVLIASPTDVNRERHIIREAIYEWNAVQSKQLGVVILPVMWEVDVYPDIGARPQEIINKQIIDESDILIGLFWSKIGTQTDNSLSGTVEEIESFIKNKKPAMIYFSDRNLPNNVDIGQLTALRGFKEFCKSQGVIGTYKNEEELKENFIRHITQLILKLLPKNQTNINLNNSYISNVESTYDYITDEERLRIQADILLDFDINVINKAIDKLMNQYNNLNVLDLGCADGYVTYSRFKENINIKTIHGVDKNPEAITKAKQNINDTKFYFSHLDFEEKEIDFSEYQIVFSALTIHHLLNPEGFINKIWDGLKKGSVLVLRVSDDGFKVNYPKVPELDFLLSSTKSILGSSDREFGRKVYTFCGNLTPNPIYSEMFFHTESTVGMSKKERENFFIDNYSFRSKYALRASRLSTSNENDVALAETLVEIEKVQKERFINDDTLFSFNVQNTILIQK